MLRKIALALVLAAVAAATAHAQSAPDLAQVSQDWARAWQAKNLAATLRLYADDAVFMDPSGLRVSGKPGLRRFFETVLAQYSAHPQLHSVRSGRSGDLGYDWGDYTETLTPHLHPDQAIKASGTYLVILRREYGRWVIADQVWTGNVPVPVKR